MRRVGRVATADHHQAADPLGRGQCDVEGDLTTKRVPDDVYVVRPLDELAEHLLRERPLHIGDFAGRDDGRDLRRRVGSQLRSDLVPDDRCERRAVQQQPADLCGHGCLVPTMRIRR